MPKITLVAVLSPVAQDRFMHAAAVFEPFKRMVLTDSDEQPACQRFTLTLDREPDYPKIIAKTKEALESEGDVKCLAVFCPGQAAGAWRDETCSHVSNGKNFTAFLPRLIAWGFVPTERIIPCPSSMFAG